MISTAHQPPRCVRARDLVGSDRVCMMKKNIIFILVFLFLGANVFAAGSNDTSAKEDNYKKGYNLIKNAEKLEKKKNDIGRDILHVLSEEKLKKGKLDEYLSMKHYVEWPDKYLVYDKKKKTWVPTGVL